MRKLDYLDEVFRLRKQGWSYPALGRRFGKDHTTIMYHCLKYGIKPKIKVSWAKKKPTTPIIQEPIKKPFENTPEGYKINKGKSYADYLQATK